MNTFREQNKKFSETYENSTFTCLDAFIFEHSSYYYSDDHFTSYLVSKPIFFSFSKVSVRKEGTTGKNGLMKL